MWVLLFEALRRTGLFQGGRYRESRRLDCERGCPGISQGTQVIARYFPETSSFSETLQNAHTSNVSEILPSTSARKFSVVDDSISACCMITAIIHSNHATVCWVEYMGCPESSSIQSIEPRLREIESSLLYCSPLFQPIFRRALDQGSVRVVNYNET